MSRSALIAMTALLVFVVTEVRAQSQPSLPDCRSDPTCFSIYMQARQQSDQGNLSEALRLYRAAYEVRADPGILFSIARVLHKQGQHPEAAVFYRRFIDSPLDQPEQKRKAQEYLGQIQAAGPRQALTSGGITLLPPQPPTSSQLAAARSSEDKPVYKRWWFWTAIGCGIVAITAVSLGIGISQRQTSSTQDSNIYEPTF